MMSNILFLYNDLNDFKGISNAMMVAERYAMKSEKGKFWINSRPNPSIKFEDGSKVSVLPVTKGISNIHEYDEVYIDDSINTFIETKGMFSESVNFYNDKSFS